MSKQNGVMKESQPPIDKRGEPSGSSMSGMGDEQPQTPRIVPLTALQRDYLQQYAISLNQATAKVEAAKTALKLAEETEGLAQNAANAFLRFCAEDLAVDLRVWTFDQPNLCFVLMSEVGKPPQSQGEPNV